MTMPGIIVFEYYKVKYTTIVISYKCGLKFPPGIHAVPTLPRHCQVYLEVAFPGRIQQASYYFIWFYSCRNNIHFWFNLQKITKFQSQYWSEIFQFNFFSNPSALKQCGIFFVYHRPLTHSFQSVLQWTFSLHGIGLWVNAYYCLRRHCCSASVERRSSNKARSHLKHHFQQRHTFRESAKVEQSSDNCFPVNGRFSRWGSVVSFEGLSLRIYWGPRRWVTQGHFVVRTRPLNSGTKQLDQGRGKAVVQPVRHIIVARMQLVGGVDTCEGACYPNLEEAPHTYTHAHNPTL